MRRPEFIARQARHPHGWLGAIIGRIMAGETARDNARAIALLDIRDGERVLDVGTGHGRSLGLIAAQAANVVVVGVDASDVMLTLAAQRNKALIRQGRVQIEKASSDDLPFPAATFDKAMAVHTLYFWKPAEPHLTSIARVLKPGGRFCLGFRPSEAAAFTRHFPASVYTFRSTAEAESLVARAGFRTIDLVRRADGDNAMAWLLAERT